MRRIPLFALALTLVLTLPMEAQRRRSASHPTGLNNNPNPGGDCVTMGFVTAGTKGTYRATTSEGGVVDFTITWLEDTLTRTRTTQRVQTMGTTTDVETTLTGETFAGSGTTLRGLKHIFLKATTSAFGFSQTIETEIDFSPALTAGPASGWCAGAKWTVPPTTETIVIRGLPGGPTTNVVTTIAGEGEVLATHESVTTPAGTFDTLKYKSFVNSGSTISPAITWVSTTRFVVVRQQTFDSAGNQTSDQVLTALQ